MVETSLFQAMGKLDSTCTDSPTVAALEVVCVLCKRRDASVGNVGFTPGLVPPAIARHAAAATPGVVVQVEFESKGLKPREHFISSRVATECLAAMGKLDSTTCTAQPRLRSSPHKQILRRSLQPRGRRHGGTRRAGGGAARGCQLARRGREIHEGRLRHMLRSIRRRRRHGRRRAARVLAVPAREAVRRLRHARVEDARQDPQMPMVQFED
jgi:hypothetical protein